MSLDQLLPPRIDNTYRGYRLALWLFALLLFMKIAISLNSVFNGYSVATSADGIPLETFTSAGAQVVVSLFALLGLAHFMICLVCILVLVRYRSMIPFMFALAPAGIYEQKNDSTLPSHCQGRNAARILREPRTARCDDRWPGAVAMEPRQSSDTGANAVTDPRVDSKVIAPEVMSNGPPTVHAAI